jgi:hypothetical protein
MNHLRKKEKMMNQTKDEQDINTWFETLTKKEQKLWLYSHLLRFSDDIPRQLWMYHDGGNWYELDKLINELIMAE